MKPYEQTQLWENAFSKTSRQDQDTARLASEYASAWDKACSLSGRIAHDAHGLTLHNEAHFLRLWRCADVVAGKHYHLSVLETFIFGMAILIHDVAHTVLAYEGGYDSISATPEWQDISAMRTLDDDLDALPRELAQHEVGGVLFEVLRALHGKQAEGFLKRSFKHPAFATEQFLVNDPTIRDHFGPLIGRIAASHHWDVSKLNELGRQHNPIPPYDKFGPVRPTVLSALLRTADAVQFDSGRAPDFEFAITNPEGVSVDHWTAQNRLSVAADLQEPDALLVTASNGFHEGEARSWWVAFDLACVADRELRSAHLLLKEGGFPPFAISGVKGISDPSKFAQCVTTVGWFPVDAQVRVSDTSKIVQMLGGKGLYGDDPVVPLRELVQNAIDAVRARRLIDPEYSGSINVSLQTGTNSVGDNGYWLTIADDGLGMTLATLTGPFLSFGESGWSSATLRAERPGFLCKRFRHIVRFGIGFFSVFMISSEINVTSRHYETGSSAARMLSFRKGLNLRPLVREVVGSSMSVSTSVETFITQEIKERLLGKNDAGMVFEKGRKPYRKPATQFGLRELLEMLCPAIDVQFNVREYEGPRETIRADWRSRKAELWLRQITGMKTKDIPGIVLKNLNRMTSISLENGQTVGRASLNPTNARLGVYSVGGLAEKRVAHIERGERNHVGCLDTSPIGPKREFGTVHSPRALASWAEQQVALWADASLSGAELNFIASNAAHFGADPTPVANCLVDNQWLSLSELFERLSAGEEFTSPIHPSDGRGNRWSVNGVVNFPSGYQLIQDDVQVTLENVLLAGPTADNKEYWIIPEEEDSSPYGFVACLARYSMKRGRHLEFEGGNIDFGSYRGETIKRDGLTHGARIVVPGVKFALVDQPRLTR